MYRAVIIFPNGQRFVGKWVEQRREARAIRKIAMLVLLDEPSIKVIIEKADKGDL